MYYPHGVKLSHAQALKLRRGHRISLKHSALMGPHKLMLTEAQIKKLQKAHNAGKGSTLQLAPEQVSHNLMKGGSIFDSLKSVARKFKTLAKEGVSQVGDVVLPVGKALASEAGRRLKKKATDVLLEKGSELLNRGLSKIGAGAKPRGRPRKTPIVQGEGWSDFVDVVKKGVDIGKDIYSVGKPIIDPLAKMGANKFMEGVRGKYFGRGAKKTSKKVVMPKMKVPARNVISDTSDQPPIEGGFSFGDFLKGASDVAQVGSQFAQLASPFMRYGRGMKKAGRPRKVAGLGLYAPGMRA